MNSESGAEQLTHDHRTTAAEAAAAVGLRFLFNSGPCQQLSGIKDVVIGKSRVFRERRTTKLGGNRVSTLGPFVSKSKFIHGIVSRWGIGGSGSFSGNFDAACRVPSLLNAFSLARPVVGAMRAPASTNANSLFIMSSSVKVRGRARHCGCGLGPLAAERSTKENVPWVAPSSCCVGNSFLVRKAVGNPGWAFGHFRRRHPMACIQGGRQQGHERRRACRNGVDDHHKNDRRLIKHRVGIRIDLSEAKSGTSPAAYRRRRARNSASQPAPFEKPAARSGGRVRGIHRVPQPALQGSEAHPSAGAR